VRKERPELGAFLSHAIPLHCDGNRLELGWESGSVFYESVSGPEQRKLLQAAAQRHFGSAPEIQFRLDHEPDSNGTTLASVEAREREARRQVALREAREHPVVRQAIDILGARVKELRLPEP
jgi:hypothetical protein